MINSLETAIALLLVLFGGLGCVLALNGNARKFGPEELLALCWLLGTGFVTLATFGLGQLISGELLKAAVSVACTGIGLLQIRKLPGSMEPLRLPSGRLERWLVAGILCQVAFVCWYGFRQYYGWDGLAVWEIKARVAFLSGGVPPHEFFRDQTRDWCHPDYPLYLPLLESWIYSWVGACNQSCLRPICPLFYLATAILLGRGAFQFTRKPLAGFLAPFLLFFLPFMVRRDGGAFGGYADFPLGMVYLAAVCQLFQGLDGHYGPHGPHGRKSAGHLRLFAGILALLPWVKSEGAILFLCLGGLAAMAAFPVIGWRVGLLALPGGGVIVSWALFQRLIHALPNNVFLPVTAQNLMANADRIAPIMGEALRELTNLYHWNLLWFGVACVLGTFVFRSPIKARVRSILAAGLLVPLLLELGVYLFSAYPSYMMHFRLSFPRLLLQLAPLGLLILVRGMFAGASDKQPRL